jgi:hypothetical protein
MPHEVRTDPTAVSPAVLAALAAARRGADAVIEWSDDLDRRLAAVAGLVAEIPTTVEAFEAIAKAQADRLAEQLAKPRRRRKPKADRAASSPTIPRDCAALVAEIEQRTEERLAVPTGPPAAVRYWLQQRLAEEIALRRQKRKPTVLDLYRAALDRIEPEIRGEMPTPAACREREPDRWEAEATRAAWSWRRTAAKAETPTAERSRVLAKAAR